MLFSSLDWKVMEAGIHVLVCPPPPPLGEGGASRSPTTTTPTWSTNFRPELLHGSRFHLNVELTDSSLQVRGHRPVTEGEGRREEKGGGSGTCVKMWWVWLRIQRLSASGATSSFTVPM